LNSNQIQVVDLTIANSKYFKIKLKTKIPFNLKKSQNKKISIIIKRINSKPKQKNYKEIIYVVIKYNYKKNTNGVLKIPIALFLQKQLMIEKTNNKFNNLHTFRIINKESKINLNIGEIKTKKNIVIHFINNYQTSKIIYYTIERYKHSQEKLFENNRIKFNIYWKTKNDNNIKRKGKLKYTKSVKNLPYKLNYKSHKIFLKTFTKNYSKNNFIKNPILELKLILCFQYYQNFKLNIGIKIKKNQWRYIY